MKLNEIEVGFIEIEDADDFTNLVNFARDNPDFIENKENQEGLETMLKTDPNMKMIIIILCKQFATTIPKSMAENLKVISYKQLEDIDPDSFKLWSITK